MTIGTKTVLFGAHQFIIHPICLFIAWCRLYGFPWDPRLWVAFIVHDMGYLGKPNIDGPEGETHPYFGAKIMRALFDWGYEDILVLGDKCAGVHTERVPNMKWYYFSLLHSRYLSKKLGMTPSRLCVADKLVPAVIPRWLYLPFVRLTGELDEYMANAVTRANSNEALSIWEREALTSGDGDRWFDGLRSYMIRWVHEHKDGRADTWTGSRKETPA